MHMHQARKSLAVVSLTVALLLPAAAQAQRTEMPGGVTTSSPTPNARPLTVTRNARRASGGERWVYTGRHDHHIYYYEHRRHWFPGLLATPFLLPWYLLGGGYDPYDGALYWPGWHETDDGFDGGYGYPGPATTFSAPLGEYCATPQKTCRLYEPAEIGLSCSCRAPAGQPRSRGAIVP